MTAATAARLFAIAAAAGLVAPRPTRAQREARTVTSEREVRAELAATLLAANRFDQAATEFRRLLAADPQNHTYRLGLGRALAWGEHPQEAERELLEARDPTTTAAITRLLASVRASIDPTAAEAERWMREAPAYTPYRVAYARALARENPRRAIAQYDTLRLLALVKTAGDDAPPPMATLEREEADAYLATGARGPAIALLGAALNRTPMDVELRRSLASTMLDAGMYGAARAQYDTLLLVAPTAAAYVARANLGFAQHDTAAAQQDLVRSIALEGNYDAYFLLGALARDREDYLSARLWYAAARQLATDADRQRELAAASAELAREQRPLVAFDPAVVDDPGWRVTSQATSDNAGVSYQSMSGRRAADLGDGLISTVEVDAQRIAQRGTVASLASTGAGATVGLARLATSGPLRVGAAAHAGFLAHPGIATFVRGGGTLMGSFDAWQAAIDVSRAPAYESLFSGAALSVPDGSAPALIANATRVSTGGPLGPVDAAASWTRTRLSDGNVGTSLDVQARVPLSDISRHLFAVYQGTRQSFAAPTTLYWDPVHYVANAVGFEIASRHSRGFTASARLLGGPAHSVERDTSAIAIVAPRGGRGAPRPAAGDAPLISHSAVQLTTGGEVTYRATWWEVAADVDYGRTRAGIYQRAAAAVTVRLLQ